MKSGRQFRRFLVLGLMPMGPLPAGLIERLPLRDPVRADTRPKRFHLNMERVQFALQ
jgi:hypothetical protein